MKKIAKILAGLFIGVVVVAGVKTETKAVDYQTLLQYYAYYNYVNGGAADYTNLMNAYYGYNTGYYNYFGNNYYYTDNSVYGNALNQYLSANYQLGQAEQVLWYYNYINETYSNYYNYLGSLEKQYSPYINAFGGYNPFTEAKQQLLTSYAQTMAAFQ